jgi:hypothetical protein
MQMLNQLPDHHNPDEHLEETEQGGKITFTPGNENDAYRTQGNITYPRKEDDYRK